MKTQHRQRRGPARALAWSFMLKTAIANSFILQRDGQPAWKPYKTLTSSRKRYRAGDEFTPIWLHKFGPREKWGRCKGCQGIQIRPRTQSSQNARKRRALEPLDVNSINRPGPDNIAEPDLPEAPAAQWTQDGCLIPLSVVGTRSNFQPFPTKITYVMDLNSTAIEDTIIVGGVSEVDNELFIRLDHYQQERQGDITGRPNFEPVADCGSTFYRLQPDQRSPLLSALPASPVDLIQLFIPVCLVEQWVGYTNEAPEPARGPGLGSPGNSSYPQQPSRRGQAWSPTSVPEIYLWLAIQIYIGLHRETHLEDYWKVSGTKGHLPSHPIVKYMTFDRFQLLSRRLRISPFSGQQGPYRPCNVWSDHIQAVSLQLWAPGTDIAIDECMVSFEGRAYEKTTVPSKPTPTGFKAWVALPAGIAKSRGGSQQQGSSQQGSQRGKKRKAGADTKVALNPTQAVVISLLSRLPAAMYHVFLDNLFSSPHLFRALRQRGIAATGTARVNCGIYEPFVVAKREDRAGKSWAFNTVKAVPTPEGLVTNPLLLPSKVNQIAWKHNALVLLLTTVFTGEEFIRCIRRRPSTATAQSCPIRREFGPDPVKELPMPQAAAAYNSNMGA
ncbi:hypothetical protein S7711_09671 [Stachybotrys chartarum IBT 7711]|uniref:PiggyBac transposable element-derived protein domain-containing protein n=1 Tax=Stachybotrys chartarum (strain CBS 109288 / IBT 7711) TaxID=1280523 RepID=A0A084BBF2_STACB|nr:hypothetical protein S7711_09671 [Stachybotrys chartarum IBT 7711]